MDQEVIEANERLLRKREEAKMTVQEDLGNINPNVVPLFPKRNVSETLKKYRLLSPGLKRVTYIAGIAAGLTHDLQADIADDLIRHGYAREA